MLGRYWEKLPKKMGVDPEFLEKHVQERVKSRENIEFHYKKGKYEDLEKRNKEDETNESISSKIKPSNNKYTMKQITINVSQNRATKT